MSECGDKIHYAYSGSFKVEDNCKQQMPQYRFICPIFQVATSTTIYDNERFMTTTIGKKYLNLY